MSGELKKYVVKNYKAYSSDLFAVFIKRNFDFTLENGYLGFMTPFVWMFIKSYEQLRKFIINEKSIATLVQMEYSAYEEATVPICSFVLKNGNADDIGYYFRLSDFKGGMEVQNQKILEAIENKCCGYFYETSICNFNKIPGIPIAYWLSTVSFNTFGDSISFNDINITRAGMITGNNDLFVRMWHEVRFTDIGLLYKSRKQAIESKNKWFPYNKGGEFRKWYGNNTFVVNWENDGILMRNLKDSTGKIPAHAFNLDYIFKFIYGLFLV